MKRKLFYSTDDIEQLNNRYIELHKKIENTNGLSDGQKNRMDEVLIQKYDFELEELSDMREAEYLTRQAELKARKKNITPCRRCWLWRLLLQPLTNRAQDIIEERAALEADELFTKEEKILEAKAKEIYGNGGAKLSKRKRKKALKKYLKYKRLLEGEPVEPEEPEKNVAPENTAEPVKLELNQQPAPHEPVKPAEELPEPPARKPRKTKNKEG